MERIRDVIRKYPFLGILGIMLLTGAVCYGIYEYNYWKLLKQQRNLYEEVRITAGIVSGGNMSASNDEVRNDSTSDGKLLTEIVRQDRYRNCITPEEFLNADIDNVKYLSYFAEGRVDFDALFSYNDDIIAYLVIPDTPVSYPILFSEEEDYYLNHNLDGSEGYPGCLYIQSYNDTSLEDSLTVIYGHNMQDDSMFGTLNEYDNEIYREQHPYFFVYMPDEVRVYRLVVASAYSDEHLLSNAFMKNENGEFVFCGLSGEEAPEFMKRMEDYGAWGAYIDKDSVTAEDSILALSTCATTGVRYIVAAKRIV